jgi:hypothetical protein
MRETRTLRATWRGLETWHGRDASANAGAPVLDPTDERRLETELRSELIRHRQRAKAAEQQLPS